jgi:hypothetical protein
MMSRPTRSRVPRGVLALILSISIVGSIVRHSVAQDANELAKKLSNPIASLISVPIQYNFDQRYGPLDDGQKQVLNIQPVIPISLNEDWNMISRTILPLVWQEDLAPGAGSQHGIGDVVQSLFFSPKEPTKGLIWGIGPVFLLPTGTDPMLSGEKWGTGPTAVALTQKNGWTVGMLANHIWSFAGDESRKEINATFLQPFISYTTPEAWTYTLNTESTYDWNATTWSVPINAQVSKLLRFGNQPVSLGVGARDWAESPAGGPEGWAFRATMTFLFPTGG